MAKSTFHIANSIPKSLSIDDYDDQNLKSRIPGFNSGSLRTTQNVQVTSQEE